MSTVISVEHVSKSYRLGAIGRGTLHGDLGRWWARRRGRPDPDAKVGQHGYERRSGAVFRALHDVDFAVTEGDVLGVLGRNGAGKSTLLKILSQVTAPTTGRIRIKGRVASLLEVGAGFHPDLTGRENVLMNGAIMGMTKSEIHRKFDEIVAFSGCEAFIDTPVKRYSSGMYVRLAFAVAAHLEPEILIVDEVLAVGDAEFQRKCLGKMDDASRGGRTVLFVSHNMAAVRRLCKTALLLRDGRVSMMDEPAAVIGQYLGGEEAALGVWTREPSTNQRGALRFEEVRFTNQLGHTTGTLESTGPFAIHIAVRVLRPVPPLQVFIRLTNNEGTIVFTSANTDRLGALIPLREGVHTCTISVPAHFLAPNSYFVQVVAHIPGVEMFDVVDAVPVRIEDAGSHRTSVLERRLGVVTPLLDWQTTVSRSGI